MADKYNPQEFEPKWQRAWEASGLYTAPERPDRPKHYALVMFPYTSGDLHIGHWYNFAPADAHARFMRMRGYAVLFPPGFDAFGLPAENAAIQKGIHPFTWTMDNIRNMERQWRTMGGSYDWSREVATCLPEYYKWNQWFFLQLYQRGLAYRARAPVNWCPSCQVVLANEQVHDGRCWRCDSVVTRRDLEQWFFKITAYADELLDFSEIEWPDKIEAMQRHWIGRSEGVEFDIPVDGHPDVTIPVYTTRVDTVFGMTWVVLAPEHPLVERLTTPDRREAVRAYVEMSRRETEIERQSTTKEKTGVPIGAYAVNPANGERLPIWIADYVLFSYGTGAIQAVPAHDERDFEFAVKFDLPIVEVVRPPDKKGDAPLAEAYVEAGVMANSGQFDGLSSEEGKQRIADWFEQRGIGRRKVNYRIRDWLISRQRYWGTPIPIIYCEQDGIVPAPVDDLPVVLPQDAEFSPMGESPLKLHEGFVNTTCPQCGGPAKRETDTMDTFVDSSWYQFRYASPHYGRAPGFDPELVQGWLPVDQYMGGVEHAVMHLLYARFVTRALRDLGVVTFNEPFRRLFNQGIILGTDGFRMSKSRGNVVNPDDYVRTMGADTVRCYLMFIGPWDSGGPWNPDGISGVSKFLNRVWNLALDGQPNKDVIDAQQAMAAPADAEAPDRQLQRLLHRTTKVVTDDLEDFRFNTQLARLMEYTNALNDLRGKVSRDVWREAMERLLLLLAPSAPHLAEELWRRLGHVDSIHLQSWPSYDEAMLVEELVKLVVTVNGKPRDQIEVPSAAAADEAHIRALVLERPKVKALLDGKAIHKFVYVPGRLVNLVVN